MSFLTTLSTLGGADPENPLEHDDRLRHLAVGVLLLAVTTWAFVATTATFVENLKAPIPLAVFGGALIATIIFAIDTLITVTPLKSNSVAARLRLIAIRGMISIAVGLVVAHATILFMYHDALADRV